MPATKLIPPGTRFTRLVVICPFPTAPYKHSASVCRCDCGAEVIVESYRLRKGEKESCGCLNKERTILAHRTHGLFDNGAPRTKTYTVWESMRARCNNPNNGKFARYGGRGIKICDRWNSFALFLDDMGERPERMEIERKDNDGDYTPENCRWATRKEQNRNTSRNRIVTFKGTTACIAEMAQIFGINRHILGKRLNRGWTIERAFSEPVHR